MPARGRNMPRQKLRRFSRLAFDEKRDVRADLTLRRPDACGADVELALFPFARIGVVRPVRGAPSALLEDLANAHLVAQREVAGFLAKVIAQDPDRLLQLSGR